MSRSNQQNRTSNRSGSSGSTSGPEESSTNSGWMMAGVAVAGALVGALGATIFSSSSTSGQSQTHHEGASLRSNGAPPSMLFQCAPGVDVEADSTSPSTCMYCFTNVINVAFSCGHTACCECAEQMWKRKVCPVCKREMTEPPKRIYLN